MVGVLILLPLVRANDARYNGGSNVTPPIVVDSFELE